MNADSVSLELAPEPPSVGMARAAVSRLAEHCGAPVSDVVLCVSEAVTNAVVHAFRGREDGAGSIRVLADCAEDDGFMRVTVEDDGIGMTPRADSPGLGLGLPIISALAHGTELGKTQGGRSYVLMRFRTAG